MLIKISRARSRSRNWSNFKLGPFSGPREFIGHPGARLSRFSFSYLPPYHGHLGLLFLTTPTAVPEGSNFGEIFQMGLFTIGHQGARFRTLSELANIWEKGPIPRP